MTLMYTVAARFFTVMTVCCLPPAKLYQISDSHKLFSRRGKKTAQHCTFPQSTVPVLTSWCHLLTAILSTFYQSHAAWAVLPCCYGDLLIFRMCFALTTVRLCTTERRKGTFLKKNGQRHSKEGCRRELVGELESWWLALIKRAASGALLLQYNTIESCKCNCLVVKMI